MPNTSYDIENERLRKEMATREECLIRNDFTCDHCNKSFDRSLLFTVPESNACVCKDCWIGGEHLTYFPRNPHIVI